MFEAATTHFAKSLNLDPTQTKVYLDLANTYYGLNYFIESASNGLKALESDPDNESINLLLANSYFQLEDYQSCIPYLRKVVSINPTNEIAANLFKEIRKIKDQEQKTKAKDH